MRDSERRSSAEDDVLAELLTSALRELDLELHPPAPARLLALARLVADWGSRMNLTAHRGPEAVLRGLVLDAVALVEALRALAEPHRVVDLGSGAGFPGLPIAILEPGWRVLLVEARERRHHFQRAARRTLDLDNVVPILGRAEDLESEACDLVIGQAMASPSQVLEWGLRWARAGGVIAIPGGDSPPDPGAHPLLAETGETSYQVPLGGPRRTLWWGRRIETDTR